VVVIAGGRALTEGTPAEIKRAAGGSTVRFSAGGAGCAGLERLPGVTAVETRGPAVTLRTRDAEATVRALFAARDRVPDLEVSGVDLEDAFLALTR
jgi:ABC-2 type transport system ATP-binding protein